MCFIKPRSNPLKTETEEQKFGTLQAFYNCNCLKYTNARLHHFYAVHYLITTTADNSNIHLLEQFFLFFRISTSDKRKFRLCQTNFLPWMFEVRVRVKANILMLTITL